MARQGVRTGRPEHQHAAHEPDDPTRQELDRWLLGYRGTRPPAPYELVEEPEEG